MLSFPGTGLVGESLTDQTMKICRLLVLSRSPGVEHYLGTVGSADSNSESRIIFSTNNTRALLETRFIRTLVHLR